MSFEQPAPPRMAAPRRLRADTPQRYKVNYPKYRARGGLVDLEEDVEGFVAGGLNEGDMARFHFFCLAFDQLVKEGVRGDIAELGVYKGNTAALLARFARRLDATAYFLDTYEGFADEDLRGIDAAAKPNSFSDTSLEAVRALVGEDHVRFIKGFFPSTATQLPEHGRYSLVHIDCDLYAPMIAALEYFYARLVPGGYLIVHDYSSLHWNGAEKAVDEFFADKPECVIPLPDNGGSVAIRRSRADTPGNSWVDRTRRAILGPAWTSAAQGKLAPLLGSGWSGPEPWGVWGVGSLHVLHLPLDPQTASGLELEFDVQAALTDSRTTQTVEVSLDGWSLAKWIFTSSDNQGVRRLRLPSLDQHLGRKKTTWDLEFRPSSVLSVSQISDSSNDGRALGLGLRRIRLL